MITQEIVRELFDYKNGQLIWKKKTSAKTKIGSCAGSLNSAGYVNVGVNGKLYLLHRLIFLWHHGRLPEVLDHINGTKSDNRIENLREATFLQNSHNKKIPSNNGSGITGVGWDAKRERWEARISVNKKVRRIGYFQNFHDAVSARKSAEEKYFGEFAPKSLNQLAAGNG